MKQRILTGVFFTLAIAIFVIPGYWQPVFPLLLLFVVHIWAGLELGRAFHACGLNPPRTFILSGSLLLPLAGLFHQLSFSLAAAMALLLGLLFLLVLLGNLIMLIRGGPQSLPAAAAGSGLLLYLNFPLLMGTLTLLFLPNGWFWFIIGLTSPWISDVFAFFTGSAWGRHKIVPKLSPKKSVEGFFGGMAGTILVLGFVFYWLRNVFSLSAQQTGAHLLFALIAACLLSLTSQLGDWLASGIKRWCGIKDFGHFLPGHGGMMDRFDSALLTLPLALALAVVHQLIF